MSDDELAKDVSRVAYNRALLEKYPLAHSI